VLQRVLRGADGGEVVEGIENTGEIVWRKDALTAPHLAKGEGIELEVGDNAKVTAATT
jgi:hypothetical protein